MTDVKFKISVSEDEREDNDKIFIPLSPNQINLLRGLLVIIDKKEIVQKSESLQEIYKLLCYANDEWEGLVK